MKLLKSKYFKYASCLIALVIFFTFALVGGAFGIIMLGINTGAIDANTITGTGSTTGTDQLNGGSAQEFVLTHYTPCTPDYKIEHPDCDPKMQGDSGTANGGKAVYDKNSPMGFYVNYKGKRYDYTGAVAWHNVTPILPFVRGGSTPKTGVYFDDSTKVFVAMDHFGSCANNPKAIDILASDEKYSAFFNNLKNAGLVTGATEKNGCSSSPKPVVKGTLGEILKVGTGGTK